MFWQSHFISGVLIDLCTLSPFYFLFVFNGADTTTV